MLKRLYIDNIRSLVNFELRPEQVAALVGPNGGGKSSVYQTLGAVTQFLQSGSKVGDAFPSFSLTRWQSRPVQRIELDVTTAMGEYTYALEVDHEAQHPAIKNETLSADGRVFYRLSKNEVSLFGDEPEEDPLTRFPFAGGRSYLPQVEPRGDNRRLIDFLKWVNGIWRFSLMPREITALSDREDASLAETGRNFVSWYRHIHQERPSVRDRLLKDLSPVIAGLE
ncbi:MAG: hypothetical protein AAF658_02030 [Myxococcota bacterium]